MASASSSWACLLTRSSIGANFTDAACTSLSLVHSLPISRLPRQPQPPGARLAPLGSHGDLTTPFRAHQRTRCGPYTPPGLRCPQGLTRSDPVAPALDGLDPAMLHVAVEPAPTHTITHDNASSRPGHVRARRPPRSLPPRCWYIGPSPSGSLLGLRANESAAWHARPLACPLSSPLQSPCLRRYAPKPRSDEGVCVRPERERFGEASASGLFSFRSFGELSGSLFCEPRGEPAAT